MRPRVRLVVAVMLAACLGAAPAAGQDTASRVTGLLFVDEATYQSVPLASSALMGATVPASADLSQHFPPPGDQGQQASCVGWAVAYALKGYQEARERGWSHDSDNRLFSPAFIYNQIKPAGCDGGSTFIEALNLLRRDGVATLARFPYTPADCGRMPAPEVRQEARPFAIADWRRVNVQDEVEVKSHLASGFPVLFGMVVDRPFTQLASGQVYDQVSGQSLGGHAMVAVGYDDGRQAFRVINSWGREWGDGGYGWISYRAFRRAVREGYVAQDIVVQPPAPGPRPGPVPRPEPGPGPQPQPGPAPVPPPAIPSARLGMLTIQHNVQVRAPNGTLVPGMAIGVPGAVANASGHRFQIVVRFAFQNGTPLLANPLETQHRDVRGLAATGTPLLPVGGDIWDFSALSLTIPYYALNLQPTNFAMTYQLTATAFVYVDNFQVAQTAPAPFVVRW